MLQCFSVDPVCVLSRIAHRVRNVIPLHALDVSVIEHAPFGLVLHLLDVPDDLGELVNQFLSGLLNIPLELVPLLGIGLKSVRVVRMRQSIGLYARKHRVKVTLDIHESEALESGTQGKVRV